MTPALLFQVANPLAILGWVALLVAPLHPRWTNLIAATVIPVVLALCYSAVVLAFWSGAEGGFGSLPDVMTLFTDPWIALAGWLHYLAFDLFVGAWQVRTARAARIPHLLVIPCLALTFLLGPVGLLCFLGLRAVMSPASARAAA